MFHVRWRLAQAGIFILDLLVAVGSFRLAHWIRYPLQPPSFPLMGDFQEHLPYMAILIPVWGVILFLSPGRFRLDPARGLRREIASLLLSLVIAAMAVYAMAFALKWKELSRVLLGLFFLFAGLGHLLVRVLATFGTRALRRWGYSFCSVLIVGSPRRAIEFANDVEHFKNWGLKIEGVVFVDKSSLAHAPSVPGPVILGTLEDIPKILQNTVVDEVFFLASESTLRQVPRLLSMCECEGVRLRVVADFFPQHRSARVSLALLDTVPLITFSHTPDEAFYLIAKRAIDIAVSLLALVLLSPVMLASAVAIKLNSRGKIFFTQERCGLRGRRFQLFKFRSMVVDADARLKEVMHLNEMDGPVFKIRNDPRITSVGRFLRKTSIDELPQLFNVLKGDMSLVGPRPPLPREVVEYDLEYRRRLSVKPGITCLWQISGRNEVSFDQWMEMDLEYIDNCSLWLDFKILARTIPAVLSGRGAA